MVVTFTLGSARCCSVEYRETQGRQILYQYRRVKNPDYHFFPECHGYG